jgi:hypothetical protein
MDKTTIDADRKLIKPVIEATIGSKNYCLHFRCSAADGNRFLLNVHKQHHDALRTALTPLALTYRVVVKNR